MGFKYEITTEDSDMTICISAGDVQEAILLFKRKYPNALITKIEMIKE